MTADTASIPETKSAAGSGSRGTRLGEAGETMVLDGKAAVRVAKALVDPPPFNAELRAALEEHDRTVVSR